MADGIVSYQYSFVVHSMVRHYHKYKEIWLHPFIEELPCEWEARNTHNPLAVAIKRTIGGEYKIVSHVPQRISLLYLVLCNGI